MKIKVLQILPNFAIGGAERMAVHLMQNLDRTRFEVAAVSLFDRVGSELEFMLGESGITVWYLNKRLGFDPRMYFRLDEVFRRFCPQVVHTHLYVLPYVLPLLFLRRVSGKVHTVHSLAEREVNAAGKAVHSIAFRVGVTPVAIALKVAHSMLRVYGIDNVSLIPNGIPIRNYCTFGMTRTEWRKREGIADEEIVFVSVGRLTGVKNQKLLLKAFDRVKENNQKVRLLIVGTGELRQELEHQAEVMGLGQRVRFLGMRTDISDILGASDVFVLSSNREGNPLALMEAMAAGKPVVATAVGGVPELVVDGSTGILVPAEDAAALAEALSNLLHNAAKRMEMGLEGAKRAEEQFCAKAMAKRYEELYERMLAFY